MIFLTGDVHHRSLRTKEAPLILPRSESSLAEEYLQIAEEYGLKVTLFLTGRSFLEDFDDVEPLLSRPNLEIGGHTFDGFSPVWFHRGVKLFRGTSWRSLQHEKRDVEKTVRIIQETAGRKLISWRNHNYDNTPHTAKILEEAGIRVWSDLPSTPVVPLSPRLLFLPVNVIDDHTRLYHGYRDREWERRRMERRRLLPFLPDGRGSTIHSAEEWMELLLRDVEERTRNGAAVINLHPVCMYLLDRFRTFRKICSLLSQYDSALMCEAAMDLPESDA